MKIQGSVNTIPIDPIDFPLKSFIAFKVVHVVLILFDLKIYPRG